MPPETKAIHEFEHVLSSDMDLQDALRSRTLDGYAVRGFEVKHCSMESVQLKNVLFHLLSMSGICGNDVVAEAIQITQSTLCNASFKRSEIDGLNMLNCQARECEFDESVIENSSFFSSEIQNMSFRHAKLIKTQFQDVNGYGAKFSNAFLAQCQFSDTRSSVAEFSRADFTRAMLIDVSLKNANLFASNFSDAILIRCDLRGVNLAMADLRGAAIIDCKHGPGDFDGAQR